MRVECSCFLSLYFTACVFPGEVLIPEVELQRQVLDAMNCVLYEQLKYKGNELDYYNSLNSYIHQVGVCWAKAGRLQGFICSQTNNSVKSNS